MAVCRRYEVLDTPPIPISKGNWEGWKYETKLTDVQSDLIGRVVFEYKKEYRASYPNFELVPTSGIAPSEMVVRCIFDKKASIDDFKGFDKINIKYQILKAIIDGNIISWKVALSNVKGIYLIVDTNTGKQYVGSAYGNDCLWQRWSSYAATGHGGNVMLKVLLEKHGEEYKYNFKYSVLEICNMSIGDEYIIGRETYWKEMLLTREFGLNDN